MPRSDVPLTPSAAVRSYHERVEIEDLTRDLYYLGRTIPAVLDVVVLRPERGEAIAPLFSDPVAAEIWLHDLPAEVVVQRAEADDPRGRVELLEACVAAGATRYVLDPIVRRRGLVGARRLAPALAYLRSLRNETACL